MQHNIDIFPRKRSGLWGNVLQTKSQTAAHKIDNQRPLKITVAISAHKCDWRTNRAQFIQNSLRANIAQMPDLIGISPQDRQFLGKLIVRIRENEDFSHF